MCGMECYTAQEVSRRGEELYKQSAFAPRSSTRGVCWPWTCSAAGTRLANEELEAFERARGKTPDGVLSCLIRAGDRRATASVSGDLPAHKIE